MIFLNAGDRNIWRIKLGTSFHFIDSVVFQLWGSENQHVRIQEQMTIPKILFGDEPSDVSTGDGQLGVFETHNLSQGGFRTQTRLLNAFGFVDVLGRLVNAIDGLE